MLIVFLYGLFCVFFAYLNERWIAKRIKIKHFLNGLLHGTVAIIVGWTTEWKFGLSILIMARLVFDTSLNLLRGLKIGYVSPDPKSIVDRVEKYIFGNDGITPKILYLVSLIMLLTIK
jgi:hypothetical protein